MKARLIAKILGLILILMIIAFTSSAFAMDTQEITMTQAAEMALRNDSQVFSARNNVEKAKLAVQQEVIKAWPQATVTDAVFRDLDSSNPQDFPNTFTVTIKNTIQSGLHLYGKSVPTNIELAIWEQINNEAQLKITEANTIYNTVSLYLSALKAKQTVIYQEAIVKASQTSLDIAKEQLRQNKITKPDELKTENDLESAIYTLEKNRSDYNLAMRQLGNQMGVKDISGLQLIEPASNGSQDFPDLKKIKETAFIKRMEMKQAQITIQKAEQQLALVQNQALPDLTFGYSYNYSSDDRINNRNESLNINYSFLSGDITGNAQETIGASKYMDNRNNSTFFSTYSALTLKLTWNLDFGTPQNQIKQNQLLLANAKSSGAQIQQGVELDVDQAAAAYELALKKVEVSRQAIPYYQKQLEIKRLQVKLGMASQPDLATAENNLLQAQNQVKSDEYDRLLADKKLQMVSGELYPFQNSSPKTK
jgi:outer membrane protein TolC